MKKFLLALLFTTAMVQSQQIDMEKLKGFKPRSIGPAGMSGRITAVDVVNEHPNIIYVGAASGGVWRSENEGISWEPIFDKERNVCFVHYFYEDG